MLKIRFFAFTGEARLPLSTATEATLVVSAAESDAVESLFSESVALSGTATGRLASGIRIGRGVQSGGSVTQSCTVVSAAVDSRAPTCALPHPVSAGARNAATTAERNVRLSAEPAMRRIVRGDLIERERWIVTPCKRGAKLGATRQPPDVVADHARVRAARVR